MLGWLRGIGFRKGVLGSSRPWMIFWVSATAYQLLRRVTSRKPVTVYREELKVGETVVIAHGREPVAP
jgi:hypothetical protein